MLTIVRVVSVTITIISQTKTVPTNTAQHTQHFKSRYTHSTASCGTVKNSKSQHTHTVQHTPSWRSRIHNTHKHALLLIHRLTCILLLLFHNTHINTHSTHIKNKNKNKKNNKNKKLEVGNRTPRLHVFIKIEHK